MKKLGHFLNIKQSVRLLLNRLQYYSDGWYTPTAAVDIPVKTSEMPCVIFEVVYRCNPGKIGLGAIAVVGMSLLVVFRLVKLPGRGMGVHAEGVGVLDVAVRSAVMYCMDVPGVGMHKKKTA
jgi:hypothetical protein